MSFTMQTQFGKGKKKSYATGASRLSAILFPRCWLVPMMSRTVESMIPI